MGMIDSEKFSRYLYEQVPVKVFGSMKRMGEIRELVEKYAEENSVSEENDNQAENGFWMQTGNCVIEKCSVCFYTKFGDWIMNYCPNCGAKMGQMKEDENE